MFCFTTATLITELQLHAPELLEQTRACMAVSAPVETVGCLQQELSPALFAEITDISIDYALMERSEKVVVVPAGFDWSDIGSWNAVAALIPADADNNRASGEAIFIDSHNNFVQSEGRLVATVGVDNLIIVDTADAVLVAHADRAQDVRRVASNSRTSPTKPIACIVLSAVPGAPTPFWRKARVSRSSASWSNPVASCLCRCIIIATNTG